MRWSKERQYKSLLDRIRERDQERLQLEAELEGLEKMGQVPELDLKRVRRLVDQAVSSLGEWLRSDIVTAKAALRRIVVDRVVFHPDTAEHGERSYHLEVRLALGNLITGASRMSVNVPDGI